MNYIPSTQRRIMIDKSIVFYKIINIRHLEQPIEH